MVGANVGFSMIPSTLPNGSSMLATFRQKSQLVAGDAEPDIERFIEVGFHPECPDVPGPGLEQVGHVIDDGVDAAEWRLHEYLQDEGPTALTCPAAMRHGPLFSRAHTRV